MVPVYIKACPFSKYVYGHACIYRGIGFIGTPLKSMPVYIQTVTVYIVTAHIYTDSPVCIHCCTYVYGLSCMYTIPVSMYIQAGISGLHLLPVYMWIVLYVDSHCKYTYRQERAGGWLYEIPVYIGAVTGCP
jgi:hypothetical protein